MLSIYATLACVFGTSAAFSVHGISAAANASIPAYSDPVLAKLAAKPPTNTTYATVTFTNGLVKLPGASFNFTEEPGLVSNLTVLYVNLVFPSNLTTTNNIIAYHVHENPVAEGDDTCLSTGGHYDPFRANGTEALAQNATTTSGPSPLYHPSPANLSTFQIGDLSGKWGLLTPINGSEPRRTILEHYLRLTGDYSISGRSVVLHDAPTDTRIACGNITLSSTPLISATSASPSGASPSTSQPSGKTSDSNNGHVLRLSMIGSVASLIISALMI